MHHTRTLLNAKHHTQTSLRNQDPARANHRRRPRGTGDPCAQPDPRAGQAHAGPGRPAVQIRKRKDSPRSCLAPLLVRLGLLVAPSCESGEPVNFSASRGTNESTGLIVTTMERAHTYLRVTCTHASADCQSHPGGRRRTSSHEASASRGGHVSTDPQRPTGTPAAWVWSPRSARGSARRGPHAEAWRPLHAACEPRVISKWSKGRRESDFITRENHRRSKTHFHTPSFIGSSRRTAPSRAVGTDTPWPTDCTTVRYHDPPPNHYLVPPKLVPDLESDSCGCVLSIRKASGPKTQTLSHPARRACS